MTMKTDQPLRGDAAWNAARTAIAKKNDAVHERSRQDRAARNAKASTRRREEEQADCATAQRAHQQLEG